MSLRLLPESLYEVQVKGVADNQQIDNVIHYRLMVNGPTSDVNTTLDTFSLAFRSRWRNAILPRLSLGYRVTEYVFRAFTMWIPVFPPTGPTKQIVYYDQVILPGVVLLDTGGQLGDMLPTHVAVSARKVTDRPSRRYRGGMRFGAIAESATEGNVLVAGEATAWDDALGLLRDPIFPLAPANPDTNPMAMAVFSRTSFLERPVQPLEARPDSALVLQLRRAAFISSQVSRKRRINFA